MDKSEIMLAGIAAVRLLARENPSPQDFQEVAAQFKKAAEVCRRRSQSPIGSKSI